jgi:hypothetical protein
MATHGGWLKYLDVATSRHSGFKISRLRDIFYLVHLNSIDIEGERISDVHRDIATRRLLYISTSGPMSRLKPLLGCTHSGSYNPSGNAAAIVAGAARVGPMLNPRHWDDGKSLLNSIALRYGLPVFPVTAPYPRPQGQARLAGRLQTQGGVKKREAVRARTRFSRCRRIYRSRPPSAAVWHYGECAGYRPCRG